jgi:hypothetical protein
LRIVGGYAYASAYAVAEGEARMCVIQSRLGKGLEVVAVVVVVMVMMVVEEQR